MEVYNLLVCLIGMGVTVFGLTCLIGLTVLLGKLARSAPQAPQAASPAAPQAPAIPNRQEMIAAVSAALAEELGTDVAAIRIVSFKKAS